MSLYLGENCISAGGSSAFKNNNIGEIIQSTIPLTDAGLHLLDGSLIANGAYAGFVDYMANLYSTAAKVSNIKVIGTLTDNNGVISGFSTSNKADLGIFPTGATSFEIVVKFKTTSPATTVDIYGATSTTNTVKVPQLRMQSSKLALVSNSGGDTGTTTINSDTWYWVKYIWNGTQKSLYLSTDGTTYNLEGEWAETTYEGGVGFWLGSGFGANSEVPFTDGSIDLNESYININGSRWWTGRTPECFTDEVNWQSSVTTYGVCGKFVYDSVNNTVRLPKITGFTEGTTDVTALGDLVEAGLSNSIYGNSTTVQPQSIKVLYYIVIATSTKTDIEVDIDEIATDLNGKADIDLSNLNNTGQKVIDGQWIGSLLDLATNFSFSSDTDYEFDLSTYLPNDNYNYEVLGSIYCNTLATSGKYVNVFISSSLFSGTSISSTITRTSSYMRCSGAFTIPVGIDRKITLKDTGDGGTIVGFRLSAYRRIGTNS